MRPRGRVSGRTPLATRLGRGLLGGLRGGLGLVGVAVAFAFASAPFFGLGCRTPETRKDASATEARVATLPEAQVPSSVKDAAVDSLDASLTVLTSDASDPSAKDAGASDSSVRSLVLGDASAPSSCKLLYGPQEQPFRGGASITQEGSRLAVVANDSGRARAFGVLLPAPTTVVAPSPEVTFEPMSYPSCELAGKSTYCLGRGGAVRRITGVREREVAKGRPFTRLAASALGDAHSVVGYLVEKTTSEGVVLQAYAVLDEGEPVRLSEDGSGATQVTLVPTANDKAVALYLDARTAMTPVHAREVSVGKDGKLALGTDVVLTVAGPAERGVTLVGGRMKDTTFALLPIPQDVTRFGMTILAVGSPPKDDVVPKVSLYANGLDPAPLAASRSESLDRVYVARVVPEGPERGAPRSLELGHLVADGTFTSHGIVARGAPVTHVSVAVDTSRTVWVLYGDAAHTWLTRYACP